jgi:hypothetical protein
VLKKYSGLYRNPWFLIAKKITRIYRLIYLATKINLVIYRDINILPLIDEFIEEFTRC